MAGFRLLGASLRLTLAVDNSDVARHWIDWADRRIREGVLRIISVNFLTLVWGRRNIAAAGSALKAHLLARAVWRLEGIEETLRGAQLQVHFILKERGIRWTR